MLTHNAAAICISLTHPLIGDGLLGRRVLRSESARNYFRRQRNVYFSLSGGAESRSDVWKWLLASSLHPLTRVFVRVALGMSTPRYSTEDLAEGSFVLDSIETRTESPLLSPLQEEKLFQRQSWSQVQYGRPFVHFVQMTKQWSHDTTINHMRSHSRFSATRAGLSSARGGCGVFYGGSEQGAEWIVSVTEPREGRFREQKTGWSLVCKQYWRIGSAVLKHWS